MNRMVIQECPELSAKTTENGRRISLRFSHFEEWIPRKFPDFPRIFLDFPCIFRKKYPRCGKHRGVWLFFIVCCIFLWEYWWYFVEYKNYRQADHRCHTDSYCSIVMTIHC